MVKIEFEDGNRLEFSGGRPGERLRSTGVPPVEFDAKIDLLLDELRRNPEKAAELARAAYRSGVSAADASAALQRSIRAGGLTLDEAARGLSGFGEALQRAEAEGREEQARECLARLLERLPPVRINLGRTSGLLTEQTIREGNAYLHKHGFGDFEAVETRPGQLDVRRRS